MLFCPKCGSMMAPKEEKGKKFMACACGYSNKKAKSEMKETLEEKEEIAVVDSEQTTNLIVEAICSKCGNNEAEHWSIQTRASDEPETQFFKCTKCGHTWKE